MCYSVFWIDDEHEKFSSFKELAKDKYEIELTAFRSLEGLKHLFENYHNFDAILLDVKFLDTDDSKEKPHNKWAFHAIRQIKDFAQKEFEIIFLSAQDTTFEGEDNFAEIQKGVHHVFNKKSKDQWKECLIKLKRCCEQQPLFQIKQQNKEFFSVAKNILSEKHCNDILNILASTNYGGSPYNAIRTVLEKSWIVFLEKNKIIPVFPVANYYKLGLCQLFFHGRVVHNCEILNKKLIPHRISYSFDFLVKELHYNSHNSVNNSERYYLLSLCHIVMDLVIWSETYLNSSIAINWYEYPAEAEIIGLTKAGVYKIKFSNFEPRIMEVDCDSKEFKVHDIVTFEMRNKSKYNRAEDKNDYKYYLEHAQKISP